MCSLIRVFLLFLVRMKYIDQRVCDCKGARKLTAKFLSILKRSFDCQKESKEFKCKGNVFSNTFLRYKDGLN